MGPIFHEKIPHYGSDFPEFTMRTPENLETFKVSKSQKMGTFLQKKIPKHGYLFLEKLPLNMGIGPELLAAHPRPIQI